jgi:predicted alpha/beta hydrolase family esterase/tetratricopeptide (TPR) repeat protein
LSGLLVLFVHGLGGGQGTWGAFDELLKKDADIKKRITVAECRFPTRLCRFLPTWKSTPLQDLAKGLATEIRTRYKDYQKILLVCHSLGGLIAKRFIIDEFKQSAPLPVREVIFFATPHYGSSFANRADLFSIEHRHLRQLRTDSDFIDSINEDWVTFKCEARVGCTYVVGGQDAIVSRHSAGAGRGLNVEFISDKGHSDIVKPKSVDDISFLLVKQAALRLLSDRGDDLAELRNAIQRHDSSKVAGLVINRGRSWIETSEAVDAIVLLRDVERLFEPSSIEAVWSHYLIAIAILFRERIAPASEFDDSFLARAQPHGLGPLVLAERMEFARQRHDSSTLSVARELELAIEQSNVATSANNAYALGVAFYLIGNLLRSGGRYREASEAIARARSLYRPPILSHQVELAHCHYALAVCRAMTGGMEDLPPLPLGPEFQRFANALTTLTQSHSAWAKNRLGQAIEHAENASLIFQQIRFTAYGGRAEALASLLGAWRRLELGAPPDQVLAKAGEDRDILEGMLGNCAYITKLKDWIQRARPSRVLGMLQFASAYNPNWTENVGRIVLPAILRKNSDKSYDWEQRMCSSLAEADTTLRSLMGIRHDARLPLLAD